MTRTTNLADLDNQPLTPEARLPHPGLLARWSDRGLYEIDADAGRFRLTEKGQFAVRQARIRQITERAAGVTDETVDIEFGS